MPDSGQPLETAKKLVLIVEPTSEGRATFERALREAGLDTIAASTARKATPMLIDMAIDAVVCRMGGQESDPLIRWVASHKPSVWVLVTGQVDDAFKQRFAAATNLAILPGASTEAICAELTSTGVRRGFFGSAIEIELFDYVQMIALTGRDKVIEIATPNGHATIWFEHGDIVHVDYGEFRGEMAFYKVLSDARGVFREAFWRPPPLRTVTRSSTHLLMEAARLSDEGTLGHDLTEAPPEVPPDEADPETSFADLTMEPEAAANDGVDVIEAADAELVEESEAAANAPAASAKPPPVPRIRAEKAKLRPMASDNEDEDFAALVEDSLSEQLNEVARGAIEASDQFKLRGGVPAEAMEQADSVGDSQAAMSTAAGHAILDDPETRAVMLEQFWQFEGINGVAIISSTGKVLAEDMRNNSSLVTLAGFYMRGAARIARALGHNVFDGVVARSVSGQKMVMVGMGAASAVLSVEPDADPEVVRDAVMGVD